MAGGIAIVVILLLFPIAVGMGGVVLAAVLGGHLKSDVDASHPGSEYLELNR